MVIDDALGLVNDAEEPIEFAQTLFSDDFLHHVREAENKSFEQERRRFLKDCKHKTSYEPGDYVLVRFQPKNKLSIPWKGPFLIKERINPVIYIIQSLLNSDRIRRVHVNRLHIFYPGSMDAHQLAREALNEDEFWIEKVYYHHYDRSTRTYRFRIKFEGLDDYDDDSDDAWIEYEDCKDDPAIKKYISENGLRVK